jgi:hypothetical protein
MKQVDLAIHDKETGRLVATWCGSSQFAPNVWDVWVQLKLCNPICIVDIANGTLYDTHPCMRPSVGVHQTPASEEHPLHTEICQTKILNTMISWCISVDRKHCCNYSMPYDEGYICKHPLHTEFR